ncbi:hypothetical protein BDW74DRAFT_181096 [Aspergillus multicolor]|uniref:uncharacterized protein n=1 Tax=Aspergillus multicolor TaxID=41759 RepID=UPI003CCD4567
MLNPLSSALHTNTNAPRTTYQHTPASHAYLSKHNLSTYPNHPLRPKSPVQHDRPSNPQSATRPLTIAITTNPGIAHWTLYIDAPAPDKKTSIQILGARDRYFHSIQTGSDIKSLGGALIKLCPLCDIHEDTIEAIRDFVLDVLGNFEGEGILDKMDEGYKVNKEVVVAKSESWV